MRHHIAVQLQAILGKAPCMRVPNAWLTAIPNHTALLLLADILSEYGGDGLDRLWDGDELILEYKVLAKRFFVSDRTISRAIDVLEKRGAIHVKRRDRKLRGKIVRNVVGVTPILKTVAKISRIRHGDILSAQGQVISTTVKLTDYQESLINAYKDHLLEFIGEPYRASASQELIDVTAVARLTPGAARGGGRKYLVWARQYLAVLKDNAERDHGVARQAAFDKQGNVTGRFTIESFVSWALSEELLPNGSLRRRFK